MSMAMYCSSSVQIRSHTSEIRSLLKLGLPVALTYVALTAMQTVDTIFVGRLGAEAVAGVSIGSAVFMAIMVFGIGILLGVDFPISRALGEKDQSQANEYFVHACYWSLVLSLPLTGLMLWISNRFESFGISPDVAEQGRAYLKILSWTLFPTLLFAALRQYATALGSTLPTLMIMVAANILNAGLNSWLVPILHIQGAAWATFYSRIAMVLALAAAVFLEDRRKQLGLTRVSRKYSHSKALEILRLGLPASFQVVLEVGAFAFATLLAGRLGAVPLAAHQIAIQIASFAFMFPNGLSSASAVLVGRAIGAGDPEGARRIGWQSLGIAALFMAGSALFICVFARPLLLVFTQEEEVIATARQLLWVAAFFQIFDGLQVTGSGILRGIGNTRTSFLANLGGHWGVGLPIGVFLCFGLSYGVLGLWIGLASGLITVSVLLIWAWSIQSRELL